MRALLLTAASVSLVVICACVPFPPGGCTLVGCTSRIDVVLPEAQSIVYTVTLSSPTVSGSVECVPPNPDDENAMWSERAFGGDLREQGPAIATVVCHASRVSVQFLSEDPDLPDELTIEIAGDGDFSQTFSGIEYTVSQPNGPDCPPTCSQVELAMDAS